MSPSQSTPSLTNLHGFPCFLWLPPEIRDAIWVTACENPRVVELGFYNTQIKRRKVYRITSKTIVPAILHACRESRVVGLRYYDRLQPTDIFTGTYINWIHDYVYLGWSWSDYRRFINDQRSLSPDSRSDLARRCRRILATKTNFYLQADIFPILADLQEIAILCLDLGAHGNSYGYSHVREGASVLRSFGSTVKITSLDVEELKKNKSHFAHEYWFTLNPVEAEQYRIYPVVAEQGAGIPITKEDRTARALREEEARVANAPPVPPVKTQFTHWRVPELRNESRIRGLEHTGTKSLLLLRLQASEESMYAIALSEYEQKAASFAKRQEV